MKEHIQHQVQSYIKSSEAYKAFKRNSDLPSYVDGLHGYPLAVAIGTYANYLNRRTWVLVPTQETALQLKRDMDATSVSSVLIPSTGKKLYSPFEGSDDEYEMVRAFQSLHTTTSNVIIIPLRTFVSPVPMKDHIEKSKVSVHLHDQFDPTSLSELLVRSGYYRSPITTVPGEFSSHGEIFDLFPHGSDVPYRIHGDWNLIEKITTFDPSTQETLKTLSKFTFNLLDENDMEVWGSIDDYISPLDYLFFIGKERLDSSFHSLTLEAKALYRDKFLKDRDAPKPDRILFDFPSFYSRCSRCTTVAEVKGQTEGCYTFDVDGPHSYFGNFVLLKEDLTNLFHNGYSVAVYAGSELQKKRLASMLSTFPSLTIHEEELSGGFTIAEKKLSVLCDHEIFGRRKIVNKTLHKVNSSPLDSFVDLNEGDYVVHVNYGIGRFEKIDRVSMSKRERDYIKIEYADKEILFVPIEQANLIQRYIGSEGKKPKLDKIGGQGWETKKARARKSAEQLASRLIELYAKRKSSKGYPFPKDTDWQMEFEASFPFEETEDQLVCVEDIKRDMESPIVMDRLVCGDVGYGKTEIALRAAFKAVMAGKQVAFLAPTTILAEQHHETLVKRLGSFPVKSEVVSRIIGKKEQKDILKRVKEGKVDILVGTHRLLQKDVVFRDLGLLIIDEEQRFGVKDKEKMKELKANIDSIALSATPIPRTLYMSLLKIRDMSLLTTPPIQRRAIKTVIKEFDIKTVVDAIRFEMNRGGQVFYLHNRIDSLDEVMSMLQSQIPELIVEMVHGQMDSHHIEDVMHRFIHQGIHVLVSTTLIENGIDIPNVNTIIIDRADRYGISQLYQLRGRVGRSDQEAFAYLFYPHMAQLSEIAIKRLKVISEHTELGSGFKIAMKDMEIRGTGNLLGKEQSGQLASVGLDMYMRILDEAIATLTKENKVIDDNEVFLELDYSGFIPDTYISEPSIKFEIYKKISSINSDDQLQSLTGELESRFGEMPEVVANLMYIAELKIICKKLSIQHLKERNGVVNVTFKKVKDISIDKVMELIRLRQKKVTLDSRRMNVLVLKTDAVSLKDKSVFILETLQRLL
ncbi:MAG: transcription-repair coupling factor [Sphaerochaetaceae bacterium]